MTKNGTHAVNLSWEWMVQWLGLFKKWITKIENLGTSIYMEIF